MSDAEFMWNIYRVYKLEFIRWIRCYVHYELTF